MTRFDAVIFDMDGVLIDSEPLWQDAEISVFGRLGIEMTREMCRETMGRRVDEVVRHWHDLYGWEGPSVAEVTGQIVDEMKDLIQTSGRLLPGVEATLEYLRSESVKVGLASSSWMTLIDAVLDRFELRSHFSAIRSAADETEGKPHPGVYLATARDLGVPPMRCLAIEDSTNGILSAKRAGMTCVAVENQAGVDLSAADHQIGSLAGFPEAWAALEDPVPVDEEQR